jgi:hypothetical protein
MSWVGQVAGMGLEYVLIFVKKKDNLQERDHSDEQDLNWSILLKWTLEKEHRGVDYIYVANVSYQWRVHGANPHLQFS